jgi:hypothetical protein
VCAGSRRSPALPLNSVLDGHDVSGSAEKGYRAMRTAVFVGAAFLLSGFTSAAMADSPAIPRDRIVCSRDSRYCLVMLVEGRPGLVSVDAGIRGTYSSSGFYRAPTASQPQAQLLWSMNAAPVDEYMVLGDGEHVIAVHRGASLRWDDSLSGLETALVFYRRGTETKRWSLADTVPGWSSLQPERTVSHARYTWFSGVELAQDERTLEIRPRLAGYRWLLARLGLTPGPLRFDTRTGAKR